MGVLEIGDLIILIEGVPDMLNQKGWICRYQNMALERQ